MKYMMFLLWVSILLSDEFVFNPKDYEIRELNENINVEGFFNYSPFFRYGYLFYTSNKVGSYVNQKKVKSITSNTKMTGIMPASESFMAYNSFGGNFNDAFEETEINYNFDSFVSMDIWFSKNISDFYFEDSDKFKSDTSILRPIKGINTIYDDATIFISPDFKELYFTSCGRNQDPDTSCDIYYSYLTKEGWSIPEIIPTINTELWESSPFINESMNKLFFTANYEYLDSNLIKEKRETDLYISEFNFQSNSWAKPLPLEEINTDKDELGSFVCNDDKTLFFSSKGYNSVKNGYDIYYSNLNEETGKWKEPISVDLINNKNDQIYFNATSNLNYIFWTEMNDQESKIFMGIKKEILSKTEK